MSPLLSAAVVIGKVASEITTGASDLTSYMTHCRAGEYNEGLECLKIITGKAAKAKGGWSTEGHYTFSICAF